MSGWPLSGRMSQKTYEPRGLFTNVVRLVMHDTVFVCAQSDVRAADRAAADFHTRRIRQDVIAFETRAVGDALYLFERLRENPVNGALHLSDHACTVGSIDT